MKLYTRLVLQWSAWGNDLRVHATPRWSTRINIIFNASWVVEPSHHQALDTDVHPVFDHLPIVKGERNRSLALVYPDLSRIGVM